MDQTPTSQEPLDVAVHGLGIRVLVAEPDLAAGLSGETLEEAREGCVLPAVDLGPGPVRLDALRGNREVRGKLHGFLVLSGALMVNVKMFGRTCARLIGTRELVLLDGVQSDSIPVTWLWTVLSPARLVLFDERLLEFATRWPTLLGTVLERAAQQTRIAFLQQAVSQLPRVEERLLSLFWAIADRQGVVRPDGIWVELAATHDTLAHMVGAQRPTVSLGLARLAEANLLRAEDGGWLLSHESLQALPSSAEG